MKYPPRKARGASNRLAGHFEVSTPNDPDFQLEDDTAAWSRDLAIAAADWLADRGRLVVRR